jgi:hypothetical protein
MELRAVSVDLDFVQPLQTVRRASAQSRIARRDEAGVGRSLRARDASRDPPARAQRTSRRNGTHAYSNGARSARFHPAAVKPGLA